MRIPTLMIIVSLGGCAHAPAPAPASPVATATPPPAATPAPSTTAPAAPTTALDPKAIIKEAEVDLSAGRYDDALERLKPLSDPDAKYAVRALYTRATALIYKKDFEGARQLFQARVDKMRAENKAEPEAWLHNAITWVRWAEHDHAGALDENELVARAVAPLPVADRRGPLLHYWWDRAYLLAETPATRRQADEARKQYIALANPKDEHEGLAVLAAFFAVVDGKGALALQEARKVDAAKDDDLQDIYVLALAHEAGGDAAGTAALREQIRKGNEYPMKPVILQRMEYDRQPRK